jgi:hypothetical protein
MDAKDLRVSDAEREHVGGLLQRAVGQGMLSLGEFTERMDTAMAAKTRGELNSVLVDLPGMQIADSELPQQVSPTPSAPVSITGTMSTTHRKGEWHVPSHLQVKTKMSTTTLDFTAAHLDAQVVEIDVDDFCSTLTLVVPDDATVDMNSLETVGGTASNSVKTGPPRGRVHVVVRGKTRFGTVKAKHPIGSVFKKMGF